MARSSVSRFLIELKRRKVYHVAAAYAVVGLAVAQGAEWAFTLLDLPLLASRLVAVVVALGFPLAVVLAWAYEIRPEDSATDSPERSASPPLDGEETQASIVVLPFDNFSPDPGDAYLGDGLTEEITTDLSVLGTLRVISRSSASVFKGRQEDVRTIGRELGVRYVLEGSVRKADGDLRITAQLIDARTDEHLWAERYSGRMDDVFAMQEEVSRAIVDALEIELTDDEERRLGEHPIANLRAYECYLRAREESWRFTEEALDRAVEHLEQAREITGENAVVLSGLAYVHSQYVNAGVGPDDAVELAETYARHALDLDPRSPQAHLVLGFLFEAVWRDPKRAILHLERSLRERPDDSHALLWLAVASSLTGDRTRMRRAADRALEVDPLTPMLRVLRGFVPMMEGRFDEAVDHFAEFWETVPDNRAALMFYALVLAWSGRAEESRRLLSDELPPDPESSFGRFSLLLRHALEGDEEKVASLVSGRFRENMIRDTQFAVFTASVHALAGMRGEALDWIETAVEGGFTNYPWLAEHDPFLSTYHGDPRFDAILEKVELRWRQDVHGGWTRGAPDGRSGP